MKKKFAFLGICAAVILSLTACGEVQKAGEPPVQQPSEQAAASMAEAQSETQTESHAETQTELGVIGTAVTAHGEDTAAHPVSSVTPAEALAQLQADHQEALANDTDAALRQDLTENGQHPYAIVVTCSDSRVSPEIMFGSQLGEVFVIRTAGNVVDDFEVGSVEYAAEHLGSPLVVVMGHTNCGAVTAAVGNAQESGDIAEIVKEIIPSVLQAKETETEESAILNKAIELNVENTIAKLQESRILQHLMESGNLRIVGAIYDITTGEVSYLNG